MAISATACRNLAVRPSRTSEAGTSGGTGSPAAPLPSPGPSVMTSRVPRAPASRVSAVAVGLPRPFSRLAMYGTDRPASAATDATVRPAAVRRARSWRPIASCSTPGHPSVLSES